VLGVDLFLVIGPDITVMTDLVVRHWKTKAQCRAADIRQLESGWNSHRSSLDRWVCTQSYSISSARSLIPAQVV
jgi:hypothetical protein